MAQSARNRSAIRIRPAEAGRPFKESTLPYGRLSLPGSQPKAKNRFSGVGYDLCPSLQALCCLADRQEAVGSPWLDLFRG